MKGAIVTGANGFMGHHLVQTLIDNDYKVYAVIRSEESEVSCIDQLPNVKLVYCDDEKLGQSSGENRWCTDRICISSGVGRIFWRFAEEL